MTLTEETIKRLSLMADQELRVIKNSTADAKGGTYQYRVFLFVDRLLREREGIRLCRTL